MHATGEISPSQPSEHTALLRVYEGNIFLSVREIEVAFVEISLCLCYGYADVKQKLESSDQQCRALTTEMQSLQADNLQEYERLQAQMSAEREAAEAQRDTAAAQQKALQDQLNSQSSHVQGE